MMTNPYLDELLDHYEVFYLMTRSAAMLGSQSSELFDRDAQLLIDFLGQVNGWSRELTDAAMDLILGDMMRIGLVSDYHALASAEMLGEGIKDNLLVYEIKGKAIEEVNRMEAMVSGRADCRAIQEIRNGMCFASFHHKYEPRIRYSYFIAKANEGDPLATLQAAMHRILGIGCDRNIMHAQKLLERSLLWGEKAAARILGFLWKEEGDGEMCAFYETVFDFLNSAGETQELLPGNAGKNMKAIEYCRLISAVRSFLVRNNGRYEIDAAFADLINCGEIPFSVKLAWIFRYREGIWLKHYLTDKKTTKIGFLD